ncbi:MAG: TIGR02646 family protein [Halochromatium sp.]|nr:TIGR02646 family protein [Halochromatium sp.]
MHQLTRPSAPGCLRRYRYGRNTWCDVSPDEKTEIWRSLDLMQDYRCAYCEASLKTKSGQPEGHIEHFRQRKHHPQGTFDWQNLFGSCNRQESCGKHKDRQCYDHGRAVSFLVSARERELDDTSRPAPVGPLVVDLVLSSHVLGSVSG